MQVGPPRLIGLPYDASSSYLRGAAAAPPLIRMALFSSAGNPWTERLRDLSSPDGLTDAGDVPLSQTDAARAEIEESIDAIFVAGGRPLALGGDHSVTYPIVRVVGRRHRPLTIVHVDAHPDLYETFGGDRFSHASPLARIMEEGLATRLLQIGIRARNAHQQRQAERFGVETIDMQAWVAGVRPSVDGQVYLSVDLDALDPAYAPGVSHREPGGLSVRDVVGIVQDLGGTLVGADVVEFNPVQDVAGLTAIVAAKLVKEIAGRMLADGRPPGSG